MTALENRTIAIPETRELELLARMLEAEGATVLRFPLVAILDAEDPAPVRAWIEALGAGHFDDVVLYTGEGVRRLHAVAKRMGLEQQLLEGLSRTRKITRGPKPAVALRELRLVPDVRAEAPTTDGIVATLSKLDLRGRQVAVQLYGTDPNERLMEFLRSAGATPRPVAPYRYASASDEARVLDLIERLSSGSVELIAFTSASQVERLWEVAKKRDREAALTSGMARTRVAAVGPVVAEALKSRGVRVDAMPERSFTLKPLVKVIADVLP